MSSFLAERIGKIRKVFIKIDSMDKELRCLLSINY